MDNIQLSMLLGARIGKGGGGSRRSSLFPEKMAPIFCRYIGDLFATFFAPYGEEGFFTMWKPYIIFFHVRGLFCLYGEHFEDLPPPPTKISACAHISAGSLTVEVKRENRIL